MWIIAIFVGRARYFPIFIIWLRIDSYARKFILAIIFGNPIMYSYCLIFLMAQLK